MAAPRGFGRSSAAIRVAYNFAATMAPRGAPLTALPARLKAQRNGAIAKPTAAKRGHDRFSADGDGATYCRWAQVQVASRRLSLIDW